jgi:oligo-1,6-glucosidase
MTNIELDSIDKYIDVASINMYHSFFTKRSEAWRLHRIHVSSRDSARTPMQWSAEPNAGFTTGTPWFHVNPNYTSINAEAEEKDPNSILNFYRRCLALRKSSDTLLFGDYREYDRLSGRRYVYERTYNGERILVMISFSERPQSFRLPKGYTADGAECLLGNYDAPIPGTLRPYEAQVFRWKAV